MSSLDFPGRRVIRESSKWSVGANRISYFVIIESYVHSLISTLTGTDEADAFVFSGSFMNFSMRVALLESLAKRRNPEDESVIAKYFASLLREATKIRNATPTVSTACRTKVECIRLPRRRLCAFLLLCSMKTGVQRKRGGILVSSATRFNASRSLFARYTRTCTLVKSQSCPRRPSVLSGSEFALDVGTSTQPVPQCGALAADLTVLRGVVSRKRR